MRIENIIGKPVLAHNFFGRDHELQAISEREHVLLLAPRRVGKTSLLHALVKRSCSRSARATRRERGFARFSSGSGNLRQHPDGAATLRFVLAGSIGLDNITRRHHLTDTINDLRLWPLGPFEPPAADEFLGRLATSYKLDLGPELRAAICGAAEWLIPYHLQVIFGALRDHARASQPTTEMLGAVIENLLDRRTYFSYWDERLRDSLGASTDSIARALLATCAQAPEGATPGVMSQTIAPQVPDAIERASVLKWIIDVLSNDGYLIEQDGRWRFRSGLLRRYWVRHVV